MADLNDVARAIGEIALKLSQNKKELLILPQTEKDTIDADTNECRICVHINGMFATAKPTPNNEKIFERKLASPGHRMRTDAGLNETDKLVDVILKADK